MKKFFTNEKLSDLLDYMMKDHHNLQDVQKAYKYPQIASDILSSGTKGVLDFFMEKSQNEVLENFLRLFAEFSDT